MAQSRESLIVTTYNSSSGSTSAAFAPSSKSTRVTLSLIIEVLEKAKNTYIEDMLRPCYDRQDTPPGMGIIAWPALNCSVSSLLSIATERHQRNYSRIAWKKSLGACHIDYYRCSAVAENHDVCRLTINNIGSLFITPIGLLSMTKDTGTVTLCHKAQTRPSVVSTVTVPAWPASTSATNVPTVGVDSPFLIYVHEVKPWYIYIYIYIYI